MFHVINVTYEVNDINYKDKRIGRRAARTIVVGT